MPAIGTVAVDTRALATVMQDERMRSDLLARTPMGRAGRPEDGGSNVPAIEIPVPPLEPRTTR